MQNMRWPIASITSLAHASALTTHQPRASASLLRVARIGCSPIANSFEVDLPLSSSDLAMPGPQEQSRPSRPKKKYDHAPVCAASISISRIRDPCPAFGAAGVRGNSLVSGAVFATPLVALLVTSPRIRLTLGDLLFAAFVGLAAISIAVNGATASAKDYALSVCRSPPTRRFRGLGRGFNRELFAIITGAIVTVGTIATAMFIMRGEMANGNHPAVRLRRGVGLFREIVRLYLVCARVLRRFLPVLLAVALVPCIVVFRCDGSASVYRHRCRLGRHRAHDRAPHAGRRDLCGHRCGFRGRHARSAGDVAALDRICRLLDLRANGQRSRLQMIQPLTSLRTTRTAAR